MSEYKLQVGIIAHLRGQRRKGREVFEHTPPFKELFVCHIYQGRSKGEGFFLKQLGVYPGVADILAVWPEGFGFLEVKTKDGHLSTPQKRFKWMCERYNVKWALIRSVKDAHDTLKKWGVTCVHDAIQEPDLRTFEEKREDMRNMYNFKVEPGEVPKGTKGFNF